MADSSAGFSTQSVEPTTSGGPAGLLGFNVVGLPAGPGLASAVGGWPTLECQVDSISIPTGASTTVHVDDQSARLSSGDTRITATRQPLTATIGIRDGVSSNVAVHPLVTWIAATAASWRGLVTLHGAAVGSGETVVALLAPPGGGKSTTSAACHEAGLTVLSEDLLVVAGREVMRGPRVVDLREPHPGAQAIGPFAGRMRHRIHLPAAPPSARLSAIVTLRWTYGRPGLHSLGIGDRFDALVANSALGGNPAPGLLPLLTLPFFALDRPRRPDAQPAVIELLAGLIGQ